MVKIKFVPILATMLTGMLGTEVWADTLTVSSSIQNVTIYKKGAMVGRKAKVNLPAGVTVVKLPLLSPLLDQKSLQVGVTNTDVSLGNVNIDFELTNLQEIAAIDDSLSQKIGLLQDSINLVSAFSNVLAEEKNMVEKNTDVSGYRRLSAEQLSGVAAFLRTDLNDIADRRLVFSHQLNAYQNDQKILSQEISVLEERKLVPKAVVYVTLVSKVSATTEINLNYLVGNAEWMPQYEIRLNKSGQTLLVKKEAIVNQSSEEDWNDIKLTVTKNSPSTNIEMPRLERYTLPGKGYSSSYSATKSKADANNNIKVMGFVRDSRGLLEGAMVRCQQNGTTVQTDKNGYYEITIPNDAYLRFSHAGYKEVTSKLSAKNVLLNNVILGADQLQQYTQTGTIRGKVVDDGGELPGATVSVKGTNISVEADDYGNFEIEAPVGATLVAEYLGYDPKTYKVSKDMPYNIRIKLGEDEISKADLACVATSSHSKVTASVDNALQGRVAGVQASNGQPGAAATIRIHGTSTLVGDASPLYVIDGMPVAGNGSSNPLSIINPEDIVSMEVLKDGSATDIYGSRAANGVIVITTKKGAGSQMYKNRFAALQDYTTEAHGLNTVPADGAEHETNLGTDTLNAHFTYYAAPKFAPSVYMLAKVPHWRDHQLQSANVRVFVDNAFVGNTSWDAESLSDTLTFSVCTEKDVAVERKLQTSLQSKKIIKSGRKLQRDWLLVVKNNKDAAIDLELQDQIPISTKSDVKVELLNSSGASVNDKWGLLTWNLHLAPGERKELKVSYEVSVSKDYEDLIEDDEVE